VTSSCNSRGQDVFRERIATAQNGPTESEQALKEHPAWLAGEAYESNYDLEVKDKFSGGIYSRVPKAEPEALRQAARAAFQAATAMASISPWQRRQILLHIADRIQDRAHEFVHALVKEVGKPVKDARTEVARAIETFTVAAEESVRVKGEVVEMARTPRYEGYFGLWRQFPVGPCVFITPFNFPLNLVAHKVAPAIAAGCAFVLKPASYAPVSALMLGKILAETELPRGGFSILPAQSRDAEQLVADDSFALLSFTGSAEVGWHLKSKAGRKRVLLELGGNAGCIVDETADLDRAVERIAFGGYYQAGQSCISVQRVFVASQIHEEFSDALVDRVRRLQVGDPASEKTDVGPVISEADAIRVSSWIEKAVSAGAKVLCGGERHGAFVTPAVVADVAEDQELYCKEVFGPVVVLNRFDSFKEALDAVNRSEYGLQAGIFTSVIERALLAHEVLRVGGVVVGDVPSFRADHMPYGGTKASGIGREGVRYAIDEMTEPRMLVIRRPSA